MILDSNTITRDSLFLKIRDYASSSREEGEDTVNIPDLTLGSREAVLSDVGHKAREILLSDVLACHRVGARPYRYTARRGHPKPAATAGRVEPRALAVLQPWPWPPPCVPARVRFLTQPDHSLPH